MLRAKIQHLNIFQVYPDQSHSLPNVRQHQYLAMEDFFDGSFQYQVSVSRNANEDSVFSSMKSDVESLRYLNSQQKAKLLFPNNSMMAKLKESELDREKKHHKKKNKQRKNTQQQQQHRDNRKDSS